MINRVVLVGRLTKDPEYRVTPSGVQVATFTLAINRTYTNQQGEREADFINCVVFRRPAENVNNYLSKGSLAGVEGRLQSRSYENQEGRRVYVTEVVCDSVQFLEPKGANQRQSGNDNQSYNQNNNEFQNYGQDFGGNQQQGQKAPSNQQSNNQQSSNPFANANGPIDISDDDLPF
ncbi:single-stranded DNA-binding protein [Mammaliicoccus sciuri]|jgi:single-strand DNA-binding protein|uniref:Single-stranded DNA-binding protein n=1 Tax=Mammaliicoccus sciuri TaxID=1296 RepID=A0A1X0TQ72_MAMSC|nr:MULTISPECIES: single-stranded DNA-binding protein [Mammaliicoccus]EZX21051.1 single-stranded DNA-binding protein 2 [Staphylococcus aureus C0673]MBF9296659.1 single-stranded DNA-binding protein [Staphylococcus schleiferi]MBN4909938.1 single-stranded DNA-binding protein [Staphylococcus sp. EG-SA-13]OOV39260.1 single-stranded DNA-binding protein [Staphylococcus sp. MB371]PCQ20740.1 single-stranded DNA-binding protein [Klebsiella pneumoniae]RXY82388.1 single-stranded DNA-binding protein [Salmo